SRHANSDHDNRGRFDGPTAPVDLAPLGSGVMVASIWLKLSDEQEASLRALIEGLAGAHGTVPFQPHLTVCSPQSAASWDAAAEYVRRSAVLPLHVAKKRISFSTTAPMRAVVIEVED